MAKRRTLAAYAGYYRKGIAALVGGLTQLGIALADNHVTSSEACMVIVAGFTAAGVVAVANSDKPS